MILFRYNNLTRGSAVFAARGFDLYGVLLILLLAGLFFEWKKNKVTEK